MSNQPNATPSLFEGTDPAVTDENEDFEIEIEEDDANSSPSDENTPSDEAPADPAPDPDPDADSGDEDADEDADAQPDSESGDKTKKRRRNKVPARKRIRELVEALRKEEEEKNEAYRKAAEAIQKVKEYETQMTGMTQRSLTTRIEGNKNRTSQLELEIQEAQERGDFAAATKKFSELADLKAETASFSQYLQQLPAAEATPSTPSDGSTQNGQTQQQEYRDTPATQAATALWQDENDWFELNELGQPANEESAIAQQAFNQLFAANPQVYYTNPNGFYETLDQVLKNLDKTKTMYQKPQSKQKPAQAVISGAPSGTAGSGKQRRKVTLTKMQLSIAKDLGLTPEQYAAQLLKQKG